MKDLPSNIPPGYREPQPIKDDGIYRKVTITGNRKPIDVKKALAAFQDKINQQP